MYKVIKFFTDLHDNDRPYNVGDIFPHKGLKVSKERLAELAGSDNRQGVPLIELVEEEKAPAQPEKVEEAPKKAPAKKAAKKPTAE